MPAQSTMVAVDGILKRRVKKSRGKSPGRGPGGLFGTMVNRSLAHPLSRERSLARSQLCTTIARATSSRCISSRFCKIDPRVLSSERSLISSDQYMKGTFRGTVIVIAAKPVISKAIATSTSRARRRQNRTKPTNLTKSLIRGSLLRTSSLTRQDTRNIRRVTFAKLSFRREYSLMWIAAGRFKAGTENAGRI